MHDAPNFATALGNTRTAPWRAKTQFPGQPRATCDRRISPPAARCTTASNAILPKLEPVVGRRLAKTRAVHSPRTLYVRPRSFHNEPIWPSLSSRWHCPVRRRLIIPRNKHLQHTFEPSIAISYAVHRPGSEACTQFRENRSVTILASTTTYCVHRSRPLPTFAQRNASLAIAFGFTTPTQRQLSIFLLFA